MYAPINYSLNVRGSRIVINDTGARVAQLHATVGDANRLGFVVMGTTGQVANLIETQTVSSVTEFVVKPGGNVQTPGTVTVGPYTFATVPSASTNTGGTIRITDRSQRLATSDGTNWNWAGTTTAIS